MNALKSVKDTLLLPINIEHTTLQFRMTCKSKSSWLIADILIPIREDIKDAASQ